MKRLNSSDSLGALITVCSSQEKNLEQVNNNNNNVYGRGFQSMLEGLDEEDAMEEPGHVSEKKRRLSVDQVKALEKNFEVENKLEPERKVKLAQELGLQPRQVAVWFQNRRARWKTKQLERDYGVLKANYDTLKLDFESLQKEKESLLSELKELKSKVQDEDGNTTTRSDQEVYIKKELIPVSESLMVTEHNEIPTTNSPPIQNNGAAAVSVFRDFKDGLSDSDSSAILNDDNNNNNNSSSRNAGNCSSEVLNHQHLSNMSPASSSLGGFNGSSSPSQSSINCFPFTDSRLISENTQKALQHQHFVRMEEHNFFGVEETCNFFSDDQAPTLQWYYSTDQWT